MRKIKTINKIRTGLSLAVAVIVGCWLSYEATSDLKWSIGAGILSAYIWAELVSGYIKELSDFFIGQCFLRKLCPINGSLVTTIKTVALLSSVSFACLVTVIFTSTLFYGFQEVLKKIL